MKNIQLGIGFAVVDGRVELTIHIDNLTGNEAIILYVGKNTIHTDLVNSRHVQATVNTRGI